MQGRKILGVALVLALLGLTLPAATHAQASPLFRPLSMGLGFGPGSVEPVSVGSPVYTIGDQIWAQSYYNSTSLYISLVSPKLNVTQTVAVGPGQLANIYTLTRRDATGYWTMQVLSASTGVTYSFRILVENASSSLEPNFVSAGLNGSALSLDYTLPPTSAYNIQACSVGVGLGNKASFNLPSSIGGGMAVTLSGDTAVVMAPSAKVPFSAWIELHAARGYLNGSSLVEQDVLAAETGIMSLSATNGTAIGRLAAALNLRDGRYDLRAFARGPSGLAAYEAPYLLVNGSTWVSLTGCTQLLGVSSGRFTMVSNLGASNSTWPRSVYMMYSMGGIDSFDSLPVPTAEGRIDLKAVGGVQLSGTNLSLNGEGVVSWASDGNSIYFVGTSFPANLSVGVDFGGVASRTYGVTVPGAFDTANLRVNASVLSVHVSNAGTPLANATAYISSSGEAPVQFRSGPGGNVTATLPPGRYNVTVSSTGKEVSAPVLLTAGNTTALAIDISPPPSQLPVYVLAFVLVVAAASNVVVWRRYLQRRAVLK